MLIINLKQYERVAGKVAGSGLTLHIPLSHVKLVPFCNLRGNLMVRPLRIESAGALYHITAREGVKSMSIVCSFDSCDLSGDR